MDKKGACVRARVRTSGGGVWMMVEYDTLEIERAGDFWTVVDLGVECGEWHKKCHSLAQGG